MNNNKVEGSRSNPGLSGKYDNETGKKLHTVFSQNIQFPIDEKKHEIIETIQHNDEIIIVAETGAGKSTRVPQFLYEAGYNVIVTQPRVLAAISLARHVAEEMKTPLGSIVGYHIGGGKPQNRMFSENTGIKYCTDGLQVVKQLVDNAISKDSGKETILIIDEVHEWNKNIEVLLAWIKKMKTEGHKIKVICMSATLDADRLQTFFSGEQHNKTQKIDVGGRLFSVTEKQEDKDSLIETIVSNTIAGANTLVFQPGKKEIDECIQELHKHKLQAVILPLHGELSADEQQRIYMTYTKPVIIVSTNIAQTSVTIPYIDAVVDSGLERRIELINGVETLVLGNISKADIKQRAGRAGRCKEGTYVLCNDTYRENFANYPIPEIQRTRVDLNYIRILASTGLKMEDLDFFHPIQPENIEQAKSTLHLLGAIDDNNHVTMIGKKLAMLPTDVNTGKMILESVKYGCLHDILIISAIRQVKGILEHREYITHKDKTIFVGRIPEDCKDQDSDLITQLNLFNHAWKNRIFDREALAKIGINAKSYEKAKEALSQIEDSLKTSRFDFNHLEHSLIGKSKKEGQILSIAAGLLDNIRIKNYGGYSNNKDEFKEIDKKSVVVLGKLIVATPKTIEFEYKGRKMKKELVTEITNVSQEMLVQIAPHLLTEATKNLKRNYTLQKFVHDNTTLFNGLPLHYETIDAPKSKETMKEFARLLSQNAYQLEGITDILHDVIEHNYSVQNDIYKLHNIVGGERKGMPLPFINNNDLAEYYYEILHSNGIDSITEWKNFINKYGTDIFKINPISQIIPDYVKIKKLYPDFIQHNNISLRVSYTSNIIQIEANEEIMKSINQNSFTKYFEGKNPSFYIQGIGRFGSLQDYNMHLQATAKSKAFENFIEKQDTIQQSIEGWDGIYMSKKQEYIPGEYAFSGIEVGFDKTVWTEKWFLHEVDATRVTQHTEEIFNDYIERQALRKKANDATDEIETWRSKHLDNITDDNFKTYTDDLKKIIKSLDNIRDEISELRDGDGDITTHELEEILVHIGSHKALEKQFIQLNKLQVENTISNQPNFSEQLKNIWK